jgi:hypothetical protein
VGTASMSGAGTTLSLLCGRAGIAVTSSKFGQLPILVQRTSHALRELIYVNYNCSAARPRSCAARPKLPPSIWGLFTSFFRRNELMFFWMRSHDMPPVGGWCEWRSPVVTAMQHRGPPADSETRFPSPPHPCRGPCSSGYWWTANGSLKMRTPPEGGASDGGSEPRYGMSGDGVAEAQFLLC